MATVAVASVKGSPGVTTLALALATVWPAGPGTVVEFDPAGGDLAGRCGLYDQAGLVGLAAATARRAEVNLDGYCQRLPSGVRVVAAPAAAEQARAAALLAIGHGWRPTTIDRDSLLTLDLGRLAPQDPALSLLPAADLLLIVCGGQFTDLAHLSAALPGIAEAARGRVGLVMVGDSPWPVREVAAVLRVPVYGVLPVDARAARLLPTVNSTRRAVRWRLVAAVSLLAPRVQQLTKPPTGPDKGVAPAAWPMRSVPSQRAGR
jgi:hypothetical protein